MLLDFVYRVVGGLIVLATKVIPRLPQSTVSWVRTTKNGAGNLASGVPYMDLIPWSTVKTVSVIVPAAIVLSVAIRLVRTLVAWVRSRGASSD